MQRHVQAVIRLLQEATAKIDEYARGMISGTGSTLFEELGLYYIGPLDGHNLDALVGILQGVLLNTPSSSHCLFLSPVYPTAAVMLETELPTHVHQTEAAARGLQLCRQGGSS